MPLMTQIRNNLSKAFGVFAVAFILYIIFDWGMDITGRRPNTRTDEIGVINGKDITYQQFTDYVHRSVENYKKQTGKDPDEEADRQIRSQVWNELLMNALIEEEVERLGIKVTDQEVIDIVHGPNPPEFLVQQFRDSTGNFNREAYEGAIRAPENKNAWVQVEDILRNQRKREKLQSLLMASVRISEGEIRKRYDQQNVTMEGEYVLFDPSVLIPDSAVSVNESDLKKYYDEHQEDYKVNAVRKLSYVVFGTSPSSADSQEVKNELLHIKEQTSRGIDFLQLAKTYSEVPPSDAFFKHGELGKSLENEIFSAKVGEIVGPIADFDGFHLARIDAERKSSAEFLRVSHILLRASPGSDTLTVINKAMDLLKQIRSGEDFAELAKKHSEDGSAQNGGDLGWTAKGQWVKPFENAAWKGRVGEVLGPIRTQFGWHLIKVVGRDSREIKITNITMKVKASSQTIEDANQQAQDFVYLAKDESFEKAAQAINVSIKETPEFQKGTYIPGIGQNEYLMHFAFEEKAGSMSEIVFVTSGYAVFRISFVRDEGFRPFEDVKVLVPNQALREKKLQMLQERVETFRKSLTSQNDLVKAATAFPGAVAQRVSPFKPNDAIPGIGYDPVFSGVAMSLQIDEISNPFKGQGGYYIFKLTSRASFDSVKYSSERLGIREQVLQEKRNRIIGEWTEALKENADIKDYRYKFFR